MIARRLRFGTVLVAVVLSLTGFSRSHSHGHSHSSHGGGCSSSKSHSSSTTHHHYDNDNYGSSSGSTSGTSSRYSSTPTPSATPSARANVTTCVRTGVTSATVRVSAASRSGTHNYQVTLDFLGANGTPVDSGEAAVQVYSGSSATLKVPMDNASKVSDVKNCVVRSVRLLY